MFNTDLLNEITLSSAATVPIILSLVQIIKMTGLIKDRFAPIASVVIGILIAFLLVNTDGIAGNDGTFHLGTTILTGIMFGLSASGLYSGISTTKNAIKMDRMNSHNKDKQTHNKHNKH